MNSQSNINTPKNSQRGIAILFSLIALLLLTAITASLIILSGTETTVNANYRTEETAFFAAKTGIYEALDRMQQSNASSIAANIPTVVPSATGGVLYIINSGSSLTVQPWNTANTYYDDELCHEGYTIAGMSSAPPDVPCTTVPSGTSWYATVNSNYPWSGTSAAMPYEWVRINWKLNNSLPYLATTTTGGVTTTSTSNYSVNSTGAAATPVCWNGAAEVLLTTGDTNCGQMQSGSPPTADTPVYLITALAITPNGSRQMLQTEAAIPPPTVISTPAGFSNPDGFFTNSTTCSSSGGSAPFVLSGGATVDGYNSSNGGTYASTKSNSLGSVGSNGSILLSGSTTNLGGHAHVLLPAVNGTCGPPATSDLFTNGGATYGGVVGISSYTPPVPSIPAPGTTDITPASHSTYTLAPGSYQNITVNRGATLVLTAPGVFNINCMTFGGNSFLQISPSSNQVVVNVTGTSCSGNAPIDLSGGSVSNSSGVAANLIINYAGNQQVKLSGGSSTYMVVNAPNASAKLSGGSDFYGSIVTSAIDDSGGTNLHFDNALTTAPSSGTTTSSTFSSSYQSLSFRSLPY